MKLNFENSRGVERCIAEVATLEEAHKEIQKFLDDHNFKSYYTNLGILFSMSVVIPSSSICMTRR